MKIQEVTFFILKIYNTFRDWWIWFVFLFNDINYVGEKGYWEWWL